MSARSNPFEEIERLFDRISRQFDEASRRWEADSPFGRWESVAVDLVEHDDQFVVTVDLPGFERDDIDIGVTDQMLRIDADHEESIDESEAEYIRHERRIESVQRSIRLPDEVDTSAVTAHMRNGVLTVTLPKLDVEEAQHIEIEDE